MRKASAKYLSLAAWVWCEGRGAGTEGWQWMGGYRLAGSGGPAQTAPAPCAPAPLMPHLLAQQALAVGQRALAGAAKVGAGQGGHRVKDDQAHPVVDDVDLQGLYGPTPHGRGRQGAAA